jgi:hypothetical protein
MTIPRRDDSMTQDEDFITVAGAARLAGVSEITVRRWMDDPSTGVRKYKDGRGRVWADRNDIIRHNTPVAVPYANQ